MIEKPRRLMVALGVPLAAACIIGGGVAFAQGGDTTPAPTQAPDSTPEAPTPGTQPAPADKDCPKKGGGGGGAGGGSGPAGDGGGSGSQTSLRTRRGPAAAVNAQ